LDILDQGVASCGLSYDAVKVWIAVLVMREKRLQSVDVIHTATELAEIIVLIYADEKSTTKIRHDLTVR
jgi:hypothetical protein